MEEKICWGCKSRIGITVAGGWPGGSELELIRCPNCNKTIGVVNTSGFTRTQYIAPLLQEDVKEQLLEY